MAVDRAKLGKRNKRMGSDAERYYAKSFREQGFEHCKTSRQASKLFDDCGIDLMFLPFNVQVKAGVQKGMKVAEVIQNMKDKMKVNFPPTSPELGFPCIVIHKKPAEGRRRIDTEEIVSMTYADFTKFIQ